MLLKRLIAILCVVAMTMGINSQVFADNKNPVKKDTVAPVITKTSQKNNAVNVNTNKEIVITFSENVVKGQAFSKIKITDKKNKVLPVKISINKNTCVIKPKTNFEYNSNYTLTIPVGAVKDKAGNSLKKSLVLKFKTKSKPAAKPTKAPAPTPIPKPTLKLKFLQNGNIYEVKNQNEEITLDRNTFTMRFNMFKYGCAQIAALDKEQSFNLTKSGAAVKDVIYFSEGSGLASDGEYKTMYIDNESNHYLIYSGNPEESRVKMIGENEDNILDVEWRVNGISRNDESSIGASSFKDIPQEKIYLVVFVDFDGDAIIDPGEYLKVIAKFKN